MTGSRNKYREDQTDKQYLKPPTGAHLARADGRLFPVIRKAMHR